MNIKPKVLGMSVGIGVVLQGLIVLVNLGLSAATLAAATSAGGGDSTLVAIVGMVSVLSFISCICALVFDAGFGALYAYLHSRESALTVADGALGGAATSALVRVISTLCTMCGTMGVTLAMSSSASQSGTAVMNAVLGGMVGLCTGIIGGAILGAIGGAIAGAVLRSQTAAV
jgi:hypothetical protein